MTEITCRSLTLFLFGSFSFCDSFHWRWVCLAQSYHINQSIHPSIHNIGKGGKNRRRGKGDGEESKRELEFKEDGAFHVQHFLSLTIIAQVCDLENSSCSFFAMFSLVYFHGSFDRELFFVFGFPLHPMHFLFLPSFLLLQQPQQQQRIIYISGQEYAQVVKMLGNGRCECFCFDGVTRLGHIRGKMRKKVWITAGDIILVAKRDFQDEKVDIVHKYSADEARNLKQYGELPENARINETAVDMAMGDDNDDDDIGIAFDDI